ncbi:MAG: hypothetical protein ACO3ZW_05850 [Opitutales bacterium]|jgi:hypothetical protein
MKSAYELAMERLREEETESGVSLSEEQKQALADIDQKYKAKIAEREVFLASKLKEARASRDADAVNQLEKQLRNERLRLEDERESKKNLVRKGELQ